MHALGDRADMLGPGPAATSDDLRSGFDPPECVGRKLVGCEVVRAAAGRSTFVERSPEVRPEVRIGAKRHAGIAQCAQAVRDLRCGQAVHEEGGRAVCDDFFTGPRERIAGC